MQNTLFSVIQDGFNASCALASGILTELIYYSVTSLLVDEKIMIEMPTFCFLSTAGVSSGSGTTAIHDEPGPMTTFRFAEPVFIEPQQNFRVEMLFPHGVPRNLANVSGPLRIWVVLDGYLMRDVQLGNPVGFWRQLRRFARRALKFIKLPHKTSARVGGRNLYTPNQRRLARSGERMGIDHQVSSVLARLNVASREEATALARQHPEL